ncbi:MAG: PRC-barrel domain-containing protein [Thermohalobaculum sp.]|nr:PRC-barrel domain-containing protein [Thermohalobaculum sp.]
MNTQNVAHASSPLLLRAQDRAPAVRAACLAGATAIALALALPAAAQQQQQPATVPDTLPATEGTGQTTSPATGVPKGGDAVQAPAETDTGETDTGVTDTGTAGLAADAESTAASEQPVPFDGQIVAQEEGTFAISDLMGANVTGPDGADIGKVKDVLLNDQNQIGGILVSIGGFLGFGEKLVGVDIARAHLITTPLGETSITLDVGVAELERAPAFASLEDQRLEAEENAARQAAEQRLQDTTRSTTAPPPTQ